MGRPPGSKNKPKTSETDKQTIPVKAQDVQKSISAPRLKELLKATRTNVDDVKEMNKGLSERVAEAVKKHNLHRKAFAWLKAIDRMPAETAKELVDWFLHYLEISGIQKRLDSVERLPLDDDGDDGEDGDNVHQFPSAAE